VSHIFLKQKRYQTIKRRNMAGGYKQRSYINREDTSSPTISMQALMLICVIEACEGRDVMFIDIPNAFIQTKVKNPINRAFIKIKGILVNVLVEIALDFFRTMSIWIKRATNVKRLLSWLNYELSLV
jgi:hypothetical protein